MSAVKSNPRLVPGVLELLEALRGRVKIGVVTNGPSARQRNKLESFDIRSQCTAFSSCRCALQNTNSAVSNGLVRISSWTSSTSPLICLRISVAPGVRRVVGGGRCDAPAGSVPADTT